MIMEIFQKLNQEGKTIVLITHEKEIAEYARRMIQMEDGKIIKDQMT
jgi:putative ABC transport system ATP-binding protein